MHIFSQSLAAAVVAVVETLVRTEVYLFLQAVIRSLVSNQSNQQSITEQNAAVQYEKKNM